MGTRGVVVVGALLLRYLALPSLLLALLRFTVFCWFSQRGRESVIMGRCASVVLVAALMCAACVGASADPGDSAAALDGSPACSVDHVIVGVGPRGGLCVAFKKSSVASPQPGLMINRSTRSRCTA